jgi:hypothetical protein
MNYLYKTFLYTDTTNVIPIPSGNNANVTDFETNYKDDAVQVTDIQLAETTFIQEKTYSDFKDLISDPIEWSDVKFIEKQNHYELNLLSQNAL